MEREQVWLVVLLMIASLKRPSRGALAPGGPWPPGEDNLGTSPVPDGTQPPPRNPPLK
jgi:hypothetical protein